MRSLTTRLLSVACLLAFASTAAAQGTTDTIPHSEFNVMRFSPAPGPGNYFQVQGASTPGHLTGSAGLTIDYAHNPFVLWDASCSADGTDCDVGDARANLVEYVAAAHLHGTFTILDHLQIGLVLPLVITNGDAFNYVTPDGMTSIDQPGGTAFALADPRLDVKGRFFTDPGSGFSVGASAFLTFPTGQHATSGSQRYVGDALPTFGGVLIAELVTSGLHVAANFGGMWREEATLLSTQVGPQLTYSGGIGYDVTPNVYLLGEFVGASSISSEVDEHWLEWRAGGTIRVGDFEINLGVGTGIGTWAGQRFVMGAGTPVVRVLGGFRWVPIHSDVDGDGVGDDDDRCPSEAEDSDDFEREDGCPELDNDEDGRPDGDDPCPNEAEDADGFEDEDGCPDNDNDDDGVNDGYDGCPTEPEDRDNDRDEDGCPEEAAAADSDGDGIADGTDQCGDTAEDFDGFGDEDGCPEEDFDQDGRPDADDQCPDQAEDADNFEDQDGCPEEGAPAGRRPRR